MIHNSIDHRKLTSICFFTVTWIAELALFYVEKARALHLILFFLPVLLQTIAKGQSARGNVDTYCKISTVLKTFLFEKTPFQVDFKSMPILTHNA